MFSAKNKNKPVVVIPIHSPDPTMHEIISFAQCFKVLHSHPIYILAPDGLNMEKYRKVVSNFKVIFIDPVWQSSLKQYNKLKVSSFFYNLFKEYNFLLTYELDAFVFRDELALWSGMKFDYIGAPWFKGHDVPSQPLQLIGVGNSGFSLRNVQASLRILNRIAFLTRLRKFWFASRLQSIMKYSSFLRYGNSFFKIKDFSKLRDLLFFDKEMYEDRYWADFITGLFTDFKIAPIESAIKFSFELEPSLLYEMNNNNLPFGCHGWPKIDPTFWERFIDTRHYFALQHHG